MAGYSFVKEYTLIQQTPYIHFQHDQTGATLRATEVKPKLDRFLAEQADVSKYHAKDENVALDYKMQFFASGEVIKSDAVHKINKLYFGNMGNQPRKETVFYENIRMRIVCLNTGLMELIDKNIKLFFLLNNFGCRQSKGFGGFVVEGTDVGELNSYLLNKGIAFAFSISNNGPVRADLRDRERNAQMMLDRAYAVYAVMKGGINATRWNSSKRKYDGKGYIKGFIQRTYLNRSGLHQIGSEKAFIKTNILPEGTIKDVPGRHPHDEGSQYDKYLFVRALLGVADHYEYINDRAIDDPKARKKISIYVYSVSNGSFDIERFKSPLTIKIIGSEMFLILNEPKEVLGKEFVLLTSKETNAEQVQQKADKLHKINVPKEFDTKEFLREFVQYFNTSAKYGSNADGSLTAVGTPYNKAVELQLKAGQ